MESLLETVNQEENESLLGGVTETSFEEVDSNPLDGVIAGNTDKIDTETKRLLDIEIRKRFFSDPENQAQILLNNYVNSSAVIINRKQRRQMYQEFLRDAKKGKYTKLFNEQIYGVSEEESRKARENFSKLN